MADSRNIRRTRAKGRTSGRGGEEKEGEGRKGGREKRTSEAKERERGEHTGETRPGIDGERWGKGGEIHLSKLYRHLYGH